MTIIQSEFGGIEIMEDFCGPEWIVAETAATGALGPFRVIGDGVGTNTDSGVIVNESDPCLSGVGRLTTTDEDLHATGLSTAKVFDVATMAPLVMECRVQFANLDTKQFFFGLSDENDDAEVLEDSIVDIKSGAGTTIVYTASDVCGFLLSSEATDDEDWHAVYTGGTAAAVTTSGSLDLDDDAVLGEYQVLRLEVDPDGTARWLIDGILLKTLAGAVSTTTDMAILAILQSTTTTAMTADLDYIYIKASRNWTV